MGEISRYVYGELLLSVFKLKALKNEKLKKNYQERLGLGAWSTLNQNYEIWIHAASVGELTGIKLFIAELKAQGRKFLLTTTSTTGNEYANKINPTGANFILPIDTKRIISKIIIQVRPRLLFLTETEIWPNLICEANLAGITVIGLNARISDFKFPIYQRFGFFLKPVLKSYGLILAQQTVDSERFKLLGAENVIVTGSMKFSSDKPAAWTSENLLKLSEKFKFHFSEKTIVFGSIRAAEEDAIIILAVNLVKLGYKIIISPRHPERFELFYEKLSNSGLTLTKRSLAQNILGAGMYLDTLGELAEVYALGNVAFVGGSLEKVGGHNPFEAFEYGIPVVMGESTENFSEIVNSFTVIGALSKSNSILEIQKLLLLYLNSDDPKIKDRIWKLTSEFKGATTKTFEILKEYL